MINLLIRWSLANRLTIVILSILVMFCLHQLQQVQDRLILDTRNYANRRLLRHMRVLG